MPIVISEIGSTVSDPGQAPASTSIAGVQSAIVVDNKDPDQMGRIKVSFQWDEGGATSSWARMVQPMAGNKYGMYFLPEVGDEVLVVFANNNHDHPVVIGSLYNGQGKQADCYDADNYIKDIKTKAGNLVRFYDKAGEEEIKITNTENGNEIILNMKKKMITISALEQIEINAPNIFLNASRITLRGGDISIKAKKDYTDKQGTNWASKGDLNISAENNIITDVKHDSFMLVQNKMDFSSNGGLSLSGKETVEIKSMIGSLNIEAATTADIKANAQMTVESSGQTAIKGAIVMIN